MRRDVLVLAEMIDAAEQAHALAAEVVADDLAWRQPARLRNRIVHGYWSIDVDVLHATATEQLPDSARALRRVLTGLESEDGG